MPHNEGAELKTTRRLGTALIILGLITTTGTWAAPKDSPCCTVTSPFGSSPALAWSWGASPSGTIGGGGGSGAGKANFQDLSLTRTSDGQSPQYLHALAAGTHLPTLVLVDGPATITLMDVLVTSYSTGGSTGPLTENISFNFGGLTYTVNGVTTCVGTGCSQ